jgi:hypothetical protein
MSICSASNTNLVADIKYHTYAELYRKKFKILIHSGSQRVYNNLTINLNKTGLITKRRL